MVSFSVSGRLSVIGSRLLCLLRRVAFNWQLALKFGKQNQRNFKIPWKTCFAHVYHNYQHYHSSPSLAQQESSQPSSPSAHSRPTIHPTSPSLPTFFSNEHIFQALRPACPSIRQPFVNVSKVSMGEDAPPISHRTPISSLCHLRSSLNI